MLADRPIFTRSQVLASDIPTAVITLEGIVAIEQLGEIGGRRTLSKQNRENDGKKSAFSQGDYAHVQNSPESGFSDCDQAGCGKWRKENAAAATAQDRPTAYAECREPIVEVGSREGHYNILMGKA